MLCDKCLALSTFYLTWIYSNFADMKLLTAFFNVFKFVISLEYVRFVSCSCFCFLSILSIVSIFFISSFFISADIAMMLWQMEIFHTLFAVILCLKILFRFHFLLILCSESIFLKCCIVCHQKQNQAYRNHSNGNFSVLLFPFLFRLPVTITTNIL